MDKVLCYPFTENPMVRIYIIMDFTFDTLNLFKVKNEMYVIIMNFDIHVYTYRNTYTKQHYVYT